MELWKLHESLFCTERTKPGAAVSTKVDFWAANSDRLKEYVELVKQEISTEQKTNFKLKSTADSSYNVYYEFCRFVRDEHLDLFNEVKKLDKQYILKKFYPHLRRLVYAMDHDPEILFARATTIYRQKDLTGALKVLRKLLRIDYQHKAAHGIIAKIYEAVGKPKRAHFHLVQETILEELMGITAVVGGGLNNGKKRLQLVMERYKELDKKRDATRVALELLNFHQGNRVALEYLTHEFASDERIMDLLTGYKSTLGTHEIPPVHNSRREVFFKKLAAVLLDDHN